MFEQIYIAAKTIPYGRVASYGQVAQMAGLTPSSARVVGWALRALSSDTNVPWQRIVAKDGRLTIRGSWVGSEDQMLALRAEGVPVVHTENGYRVDREYFID